MLPVICKSQDLTFSHCTVGRGRRQTRPFTSTTSPNSRVGKILPLATELDLLSRQVQNRPVFRVPSQVNGEFFSSRPSDAESCTAMPFYPRAREEHWLRDKQEAGRIVILEDESVWEVHPSDRLVTGHWLRISTITVNHTQKEGYPYLLTNTTEEETARAIYLGESIPGKTITSEVA
jgi:hypothetical protein